MGKVSEGPVWWWPVCCWDSAGFQNCFRGSPGPQQSLGASRLGHHQMPGERSGKLHPGRLRVENYQVLTGSRRPWVPRMSLRRRYIVAYDPVSCSTPMLPKGRNGAVPLPLRTGWFEGESFGGLGWIRLGWIGQHEWWELGELWPLAQNCPAMQGLIGLYPSTLIALHLETMAG